MGRVFRAEDTSLGRHVALKVFPRQMKQGENVYDLSPYLNEARSAATLEHPHVVQVYEASEAGGVFYIAMELIEGGNLQQLVKASGPLDVARACQLGCEAGEALAYAHGMGVIHRDVKPSNLLLTRAGRCKLSDFGLANLDDGSSRFQFPTECVGTPHYIAPEVARGSAATPLSDVYELGGTMWFLLTGQTPYDAGTAADVMKKHVKEKLPNLKKLRADLPDDLIDVVYKAMAKNPEERFESAAQFAKVLRLHTISVGSSSSGIGAAVDGALVGARKHRHNPIVTAISAVIITLVAVVATFFIMSLQSQIDDEKKAKVKLEGSMYYRQLELDRLRDSNKKSGTTPVPVNAPVPSGAAALTAPAVETGILSATDAATLARISSGNDPLSGRTLVVQGTVEAVAVSPSGKVCTVTFRGVSRDTFSVVYFPAGTMFERMATTFGGQAGSGLVGKTIRVSGVVDDFKGSPQIVVKSPEQVQIVTP